MSHQRFVERQGYIHRYRKPAQLKIAEDFEGTENWKSIGSRGHLNIGEIPTWIGAPRSRGTVHTLLSSCRPQGPRY